MTETVDSTATEEPVVQPSLALAEREHTTLAVTPQVEATELVQRLDVIREAMNNAMRDGVDYGLVPGVNKPSLLKPGAEKLGVLFQLDIQLVNEKTWGPGDHLTVESRATVYHAPTGVRVGFGEGLCSTREKKYAKRKAQRVCPQCGVTAIIKGKPEYGGGWVCFKKKDGCGAKFPDGDQSIESQEVGEVDNTELPDTWNTVIKMAEKRARVDAVLAVTGASALFTQDAEDTAAPEVAAIALPDWARLASDDQQAQVRRGLAYLLGDTEDGMRVAEVLSKLERDVDVHGLPWIAGRALLHVASTHKDASTEGQA